MNPSVLSKLLRDSIPALFECTEAPRGAVRVRTPLFFPDGDRIDLFVVEQDGAYLLTDFADTTGWLRMQSVSGEMTPNQRALVDDVCLTLGIRRERGQLMVRVAERTAITDALHRLGQAALRVADIQFTFRPHESGSIADEVDGWLRAQSFNILRSVKRGGSSGIDWTVDYEVSSNDRTSLLFLLAGDTPSAVRQRSAQVFAGCSDLRDRTPEPSPIEMISLFDDDSAGWREEHLRLVEKVSHAVRWSQREELARLLANGALPRA